MKACINCARISQQEYHIICSEVPLICNLTQEKIRYPFIYGSWCEHWRERGTLLEDELILMPQERIPDIEEFVKNYGRNKEVCHDR
jgi:hypothetical protein